MDHYMADTDLPWDQPHGLRVLPEVVSKGQKVLSDASPIAWPKWVHFASEGKQLKPGKQHAG
eukprot:1574229-Lingulodinium_polyedra.AAC.1